MPRKNCPYCKSSALVWIVNYDSYECQSCHLTVSGQMLEELDNAPTGPSKTPTPVYIGEATIKQPVGELVIDVDSEEYSDYSSTRPREIERILPGEYQLSGAEFPSDYEWDSDD